MDQELAEADLAMRPSAYGRWFVAGFAATVVAMLVLPQPWDVHAVCTYEDDIILALLAIALTLAGLVGVIVGFSLRRRDGARQRNRAQRVLPVSVGLLAAVPVGWIVYYEFVVRGCPWPGS